MKRQLLTGLGCVALGSTAHAASLTDLLPAGALMTLETRDASGVIGRVSGLLGNVMDTVAGADDGMTQSMNGMQELLKGSVGREAAVGVFTVGRPGGTYSPEVLAVSRVDDLSREFFGSLLKKKAGARVGVYTFARQGTVYAGMAGGLVYVSSDKALLMGYLGRLSGKAAPTLLGSGAYTAARRPVGAQELALYVNFSAAAKVVRGYLGTVALPRVLAPVVDAIDTLGQYSSGLTTTSQGLTAASAHVANAQGKDRPLYRLLTHTTDFHVQDIIPADAERVSARACAPEDGAYLGRWLTRVDLLDPLGFLTDSQLASHLERAGGYVGDECAQVMLAGGMKSALDVSDPLASLPYSVSYRRIRDLDAARAHMPEYAASVNAAIAGAADALLPLLERGTAPFSKALPGGLGSAAGMGGAALEGSAKQVRTLLGGLKLVYAFRGDYLITAWSDAALKTALDGSATPLAQDAAFQAAALPMSGAAWSYQPDQPELAADDLRAAMEDAVKRAGGPATDDMEDAQDDLTEEEAAMQAAIDKLGARSGPGLSAGADLLGSVADPMTDVINRYDGMSAQSRVQGNVILGKASVRYRWE
ncbi:hypothetical protein HNQ07_003160 [Deinococcus metalli]|uniref:DUF3352 domain-containing protein n=1 Tax=Deinococcus metalli TaxID=1141878 RepID=A0A7W8NQ97_9DEIO|nr:hypothetical protein [Deinococcus metalli]MBB5377661.1 hypothetical protein [Deinococcus metalli]GHF52383.1 hypothetical protein GCM10017781_30890 [Deinococcus metalli]